MTLVLCLSFHFNFSFMFLRRKKINPAVYILDVFVVGVGAIFNTTAIAGSHDTALPTEVVLTNHVHHILKRTVSLSSHGANQS